MKLLEAAIEAMELIGRPCGVEEICDEIDRKKLFDYKRKISLSALMNEILMSCDNINVPKPYKNKCFHKDGPNLFALIKWQEKVIVENESKRNIGNTKSIIKEIVLNNNEIEEIYIKLEPLNKKLFALNNMKEIKSEDVPLLVPNMQYLVTYNKVESECVVIYRDTQVTFLFDIINNTIQMIPSYEFNINQFIVNKKVLSLKIYKNTTMFEFSLFKYPIKNYSRLNGKSVPFINSTKEYFIKTIDDNGYVYRIIFKDLKYTILLGGNNSCLIISTNEFNAGSIGLYNKTINFKIYKGNNNIIGTKKPSCDYIEIAKDNEELSDNHYLESSNVCDEIIDGKGLSLKFYNDTKNLMEVKPVDVKPIQPHIKLNVFCNNEKYILIYKNQKNIVLLNDNGTLILTYQEFMDGVSNNRDAKFSIRIVTEKEKNENILEFINDESINTIAEQLFNNLDNF